MRTMTNALLFTAGVACFGFLACNSDEDDTVTETGGSAGEASGGMGGASGGTGGRSGGSGGVDGGSGGITGGSAGSSGGAAGSGGAPPVACNVETRGDRSEEVVTDSLSGTLDPTKVYVLEGNVYVNSGDTLTIPPCTRIEGDSATKGTLIVTRGARIVAEGSADAPILFTARGDALAGSWGGLLILGSAPVSLGSDVNVEGLSDDAKHKYGGNDAADDSGSLSYVRIEYSGIDLGNGNEVNGLSLAGVGSGTTISHVMVKDTLDDCFEWFGGTVNADHLVCVNGGDDMFDTDDGYTGTISYVFGQHGAQSSSDPNGLEWDGTSDTAGTFTTEVTLENATLCSNEGSMNGMVLRRGITGTIDKLVAVGFPTGIDLRDDPSGISITNSTLVATTLADADSTDDDGGVDDGAWFTDGAGNGTATPGFTAADCMTATPAASVFNSNVGAFEGDADWARGAWTGW